MEENTLRKLVLKVVTPKKKKYKTIRITLNGEYKIYVNIIYFT